MNFILKLCKNFNVIIDSDNACKKVVSEYFLCYLHKTVQQNITNLDKFILIALKYIDNRLRQWYNESAKYLA